MKHSSLSPSPETGATAENPPDAAGLSWIGTSFLCPKEAERVLADLRDKPVLRKDLVKAKASRDSQARGGGAYPWRPPSTAAEFLGQRRGEPLFRGLATEQIVSAFEEETKTLHQALAVLSEYKMAQRSMVSLGDLENALWEAHNREARAAAELETRGLKEAHESKRVALEEDFNRREDRLKEACRRQADALRLEHKVLVTAVEVSVRSDRREFASTSNPAADLPSPAGPQENRGGEEYKPGKIEEGREIRDRKSPSVEQKTAVAVATTADPARSKEMVELRGELTRHLAAVLNADGARHLQDATRVKGLMEELEAKARLESEVKARSPLGGLEKIALQQQHRQAQEIQRGKHNRLLRNVERLRIENLRLLSARHLGDLGRLSDRRRLLNRDRRQTLRERLAAAKSEVKRSWREHNRLLFRGTGAEHRAIPESAEGEQRAAAFPECAPAGRSPEGPTTNVGQPWKPAGVHGTDKSVDSSAGKRQVTSKLDGVNAFPEGNCGGDVGGGDIDGRAKLSIANGNGLSPKSGEALDETRPVVRVSDNAYNNIDLEARKLHSPGLGISKAIAVASSGKGRTFHRAVGVGEMDAVNTDSGEVDGASTTVFAADARTFLGAASAGFGNVASESGTSAASATGKEKKREKHHGPSSATTFPFEATATGYNGRRLPVRRRRKRALSAQTPSCADPPIAMASDLPGRAFGILSEEEVQALAFLGRGAPNDPRLLLAFPPPSQAWEHLKLQEDDVGDSADKQGGGIARGEETVDAVVDRAVDKLVFEMRAEEEVTRRRFGMASLQAQV